MADKKHVGVPSVSIFHEAKSALTLPMKSIKAKQAAKNLKLNKARALKTFVTNWIEKSEARI